MGREERRQTKWDRGCDISHCSYREKLLVTIHVSFYCLSLMFTGHFQECFNFSYQNLNWLKKSTNFFNISLLWNIVKLVLQTQITCSWALFLLQRIKSKSTSSRAVTSETVFIKIGISCRKWKIANTKDIVRKITFNIANDHRMLRKKICFLLLFGSIGQVHVNIPANSTMYSTWRMFTLNMLISLNVL